MTLIESLLAAYAAGGGLTLAVWRRPGRSLWRVTAILGGVLAAALIAEGSHRAEAVPMLLVAVTVAGLAVRRSRWQGAPPPRRRRILAAVLRYTAALRTGARRPRTKAGGWRS